MAVDLKGMSLKQLEKLKAEVDKAIETAKTRDMKAARKAAEEAAAKFGFSLTELSGGKTAAAEKPKRKYTKRKAAPKKGVAKYRNPADPSQTWTGKGRQPVWFRDAVANGTDPATMEI